MRALVMLMAVMMTTSALADPSDMDPLQPFDAHNLRRNEVKINWVRANDPDKACEDYSKRFDVRQEPGRRLGCAFWSEDWCIIVTGYTPNMRTLAHETRHCFQGRWHG